MAARNVFSTLPAPPTCMPVRNPAGGSAPGGIPLATSRRHERGHSRGLSIVELLVGVAIGLLIVAIATRFLTDHLRDSRALLLESRLMQDLRTAADVITRDLRRAGYWGAAESGVWFAASGPVHANPYVAVAPATAASDSVSFQFSRDAAENDSVDSNEQFGFRLRNGALQMRLGGSNWQALTDNETLTVTGFSVAPQVQEVDLLQACSTACQAGSTTCPPRLQVRSLALQIRGQAVADASMARSVRSNVRLRNDVVVGACDA
jgi:prepilin peptidase dependent protein B